MKKLFFALILPWFVANLAEASAKSIAEAGVHARHCSEPTGPASEGRGLYFSRGEKTYLVTPLGVVLDRASFRDCVRVLVGEVEFSARRVAWNYLLSVALYEVEGAALPKALSWSGFPDRLTEVPTRLILSGSSEARTVVRSTDRHTYDVSGDPERHGGQFRELRTSAPVDSTIQGAIAEDASSRAPYGMIADEYLEMIPGQASRVRPWARASRDFRASHLVLVSLWTIQHWLDGVFSGKDMTSLEPRLEVSSFDPERVAIVSGGLKLDADCPHEEEVKRPSGRYPIGGNNGSGVGGEDSAGALCKVVISRAGSAKEADRFVIQRQGWAHEMHLRIRKSGPLEAWYVIGFAERELFEENRRGNADISGMRTLSRTGFSHLKFFLRVLLEGGDDPVLIPLEGGRRTSEYLGERNLLESVARVQAILGSSFAIEDEVLIDFKRYVFTMMAVLRTQKWRSLRPLDLSWTYDLEDLGWIESKKGSAFESVHPFEEAWELLPVAIGAEATAELRKELKRITDRYRELKEKQ